MTTREADQNGVEVWSTLISAKGEGYRYSSSGGNSARTYFKKFTTPPVYYTFHNRKGSEVRVRVSRPEIIAEIDYNVAANRAQEKARSTPWRVEPTTRTNAGGTLYQVVREVDGRKIVAVETPTHSDRLARAEADRLNAQLNRKGIK